MSSESPGEGGAHSLVEHMHSLMVAVIATEATKLATDEKYRENAIRRQELREELSSPEWVPDWMDPYYNIATWKGRLALFIGDLHLKSPIRWYGRPVLERLSRWSMDTDVTTRWEAHDDWPER